MANGSDEDDCESSDEEESDSDNREDDDDQPTRFEAGSGRRARTRLVLYNKLRKKPGPFQSQTLLKLHFSR